MKYAIILISILFLTTSCSSIVNLLAKKKSPISRNSTSSPIEYTLWTDLLNKHVKDNGRVDYKGIIKDSVDFNAFLELVETHHPNEKNWSSDEQLAYWINAYNAFTVKLILDNYPVESIKDIKSGVPFINSVWDIDFIEIEGIQYSLGNIEHGIIRKNFDEPKIHFAVNCASVSCPNLINEAYSPKKLDAQLTQVAKDFLYNTSKNNLDGEKLEISKIFNWYKSDFVKNGSVPEYIQQFVKEDVASKNISYLDYDWNLNDVE